MAGTTPLPEISASPPTGTDYGALIQQAINTGDWRNLPGGALPYFSYMEQQAGLPRGYLSQMAAVESKFDPNAKSPTGALGLFQFTKKTGAAYGLPDDASRLDPFLNTAAAAGFARDNYAALSKSLGRPPTPGELYLAHQEGAAGAAYILKANPDARIGQLASTSIANNIYNNGGTADQKVGEWAQGFMSRFNNAQAYNPSAAGAYDPNVFGSGAFQIPAPQDPSQSSIDPYVNWSPGLGARGFTPAKFSEVPASYMGDTTKENISRLYATMLGRDPDEQGLNAWTDAFHNGMGYADIAKGFAGSDEFRAMPTSNAQFVDALYQNGLGRHAEADGLQGWTDMLNHGASRGDIAAGIAGSDEARNYQQSTSGYQFNPSVGTGFDFAPPTSAGSSFQPDYMYSPDQRTIASMYAAALGRAPDQAGLESWTKMHDGGTSWADIAHQIGGSQEAIDRTGGWNNAQFVDGLYHSTLGRDADEPGLMNWTKMLDDGTVTRSDLDYSFASSPEAQNFQQSTQGYTHPQGVDVGAFSFSSMDPSRFSTLDNVDYGQGFAAYTPPPPSPTGNAWSDSYAATNAITNAEIAKANQQTEQLMNSSTAAQNQMLANQQAVGAQQQQQFNQNIANTNATQFGPAPVGQLPQLMPFNPSPVPVFPNIGPSFL